MTVLTHGPEFQRAVLRTMTLDRGFCSKCCEHLEDGFFSGELSWFFRQIKAYFNDFKTLPSLAEIANKILLQKDKDQPAFKEQLDQILAANEFGKEHLKRELSMFWKKNIFLQGFKEGADRYNAGSPDECFNLVSATMKKVGEADFENDRMVTFKNLDEVITLAQEQSRDAIPTGIKRIDDAMMGGMMSQTWTTFLGGSNAGKSMLAANLAKAAWRLKGKKTFVMIHEDEEAQTQIRYLSCFSEVPYSRILVPALHRTDEENKAIKDAKEILHEYVRLRFMYTKESFVETVCDVARRTMDEWPYDFFEDDYPQCLKIKNLKNYDHDSYTLNEFIVQELKMLACELGVPGAGGAQTNRTGHKVGRSGSDFVRGTDVGDSWGIFKKSSNVITMTRSTIDMQNNRITFLLDKVRNGECPVAVQCKTDYSRCITHLPYSEVDTNQTEIAVDKE